MIGVINDSRVITTQWFKEPGDRILILGTTSNDLGGSEFLSRLGSIQEGPIPQLDFEAELAVQRACLRLIESGVVRSAHDCSDGGLAVALAECCFSSYRRNAIGAVLNLRNHLDLSPIGDLNDKSLQTSALLFGESPSRIVITVRREDVERAAAIGTEEHIACAEIGEVVGKTLRVLLDGEILLEEDVASLESTWRTSIRRSLDRR